MSPEIAWLFPVGIAAGIVNTLAGGGSFLTLSAMIWLGLPPLVANATNRVGVLAQSATAVATFTNQGVRAEAPLLPQAAVVALGAVAGVQLSLTLDAEAFDRVLAVAMLAMVGLSLVRPSSWTEPAPAHPARWPALLLAGAYGGFLQAGVGVVLLPALVVLGGLDPVQANARKVALVALLTVPALALYAHAGLVDWTAGAVLAGGSALGGWAGGRLTLRVGARWIWGVVVIVVLATAGRLLWS